MTSHDYLNDKENFPRFQRLCRDVFTSVEGKQLMDMLLVACPPAGPRVSGTTNDAHTVGFLDGERTLVGFMHYYSSAGLSPMPVQPHTPNENG